MLHVLPLAGGAVRLVAHANAVTLAAWTVAAGSLATAMVNSLAYQLRGVVELRFFVLRGRDVPPPLTF